MQEKLREAGNWECASKTRKTQVVKKTITKTYEAEGGN